MREACYCGRTGEASNRELVVATGGGERAPGSPECGHLQWFPEDARMLLLEELGRSRVAA